MTDSCKVGGVPSPGCREPAGSQLGPVHQTLLVLEPYASQLQEPEVFVTMYDGYEGHRRRRQRRAKSPQIDYWKEPIRT